MDFSISEDQQSVQQLAQQILSDNTDVTRLQQVEQEPVHFDRELWQALAEAGLLGLTIAEEHGGMGLGYYALSLLCEEVGRTVAPVPVIPMLVSAASTLQKFAPSNVQSAWLPGIVSGKTLVTAALEEYLNDDPSTPAAKATAVSGGYHLAGTKTGVVLAQESQRILLSAQAEEGLIVALLDPGSPGVTLSPQLVTSGETRYELSMNNAFIEEADIVARGAQATAAMQWASAATRTALCATAVGLCDKMMRMTGSYTTERQQFGRAIATFQAVSHRVADCFIDVECLRLVTQQAASLIEQGSDTNEAVKIAKIWCGDVSHRVSQAAQHCHGGTGVDRDYPLFRYCLWARQIELSCGTSAQLLGELGEDIAQEYLRSA
jgi:alkylation response protein AidB-like acyl-CoA dehydrogenase